MKYLKTYELSKSKTDKIVFNGDVYIVFDEYQGRKGYPSTYASYNKIKLLNILKKYYDIDGYDQKQALEERAWAWKVWFYNFSEGDSFYESGIQINVITTVGWHISEDSNQISADELLEIGLENLDAYFTSKKYNL